MALIGSNAFEIYNSFNLSDEDKNYLQIVKKRLKEYFATKKNVSFERQIFFKIEQNEGEQSSSF